jgi:uncharacterized membrane protein YgdD (TMEM256/DUF423 family)
MTRLTAWAALSAAMAVAAAAFGAHAAQGEAVEWLRTGGQYQLIHAVAALALMRDHNRPAALLLLGSLVFAASLYLMALGLPRWLGAVTPVGGAMMIGGWFWVAIRALREHGEG